MPFLKIPDIDGESLRAGYESSIDVISISIGVERTASGGRTSGSPEFEPLTVTKYVDKASPYLMLACARGEVFDKIDLLVTKDSGDRLFEYMAITLEDVRVIAVGIEGTPGEGGPTETVSLTYGKITFKYVEQADDHSAGDEHEITYDIAAGV
jgi:type VI secretion system secreted protein Hcp